MTKIKNVIKRDGRLEAFYEEKIKRSIKNSASDCNVNLSISDIEYIYKSIIIKVEEFVKHDNRHIVSTIEIRSFIIESLKSCGFSQLSEKYRKV